MTSAPWDDLLRQRAEAGLYRALQCVDAARSARVTVAGRTYVCFASNNYLGLADHPAVVKAVCAAVEQWGWGAGASRLVSGHMAPHARLECRLAELKGTEAALVCPTGYQANLAAIRALAGEGDVVFLDKLNHHSIIDAAVGSGAVVRVFPHRHYEKLERLLERYPSARRRVIVTETLFSMDGDFADLPRLAAIKRRYGALLCVDEAHATGVFGGRGAGVAEMQGVERDIDVSVGTLSKALGGIGGFIAAPRAFIDWVVNSAGAFIYTTALPPAACAAACAALEVLTGEPHRRVRLLSLADRLRRELAALGWNTGSSGSQIIPLIVGEPEEATALSRRLASAGLWVPAIRPPTVPPGGARLRISLSSEHTHADIEALLAALGPNKPGRR